MPTSARVRRVAMVSMHTSPLARAGSGDAGGMNVYLDGAARSLVQRGVAVDAFTRVQSPADPAVVGGAILLVVLSLFGFDFDSVARQHKATESTPRTDQ